MSWKEGNYEKNKYTVDEIIDFASNIIIIPNVANASTGTLMKLMKNLIKNYISIVF